MEQRVRSSVVTAAAWVTAVVQVQTLARELPHAMNAAKKKKKKFSVEWGAILNCVGLTTLPSNA